MTTHPSVNDRNFPACQCTRCGFDVPESRIRSSALMPVPPPTVPRSAPPVEPYRPVLRGEEVFDTRTGQWGVFMGWHHGMAFLRPPGGGVEWDTAPHWLADRAPEPSA
ncbi:hypothetical protein ACWGB8_23245 [Kitasatospora sp. NPDC054939]